MNEKQLKLLITGCGRSGTRYVASLLKGMKLDIGHEELGTDGVASWCMAVDSEDAPWGIGRRGLKFNTILHQVRHPLKVIPSLTTFTEPSWKFIERFIDCPASDPVVLRGVKYWYHWNREAEKFAEWTYRVENLPNVFDEFCRRIDLTPDRQVLEGTSTKINRRQPSPVLKALTKVFDKFRYAPRTKKLDFIYGNGQYLENQFTWEEMERLAPGWSSKIKEETRRYGYVDADDEAALLADAKGGG